MIDRNHLAFKCSQSYILGFGVCLGRIKTDVRSVKRRLFFFYQSTRLLASSRSSLSLSVASLKSLSSFSDASGGGVIVNFSYLFLSAIGVIIDFENLNTNFRTDIRYAYKHVKFSTSFPIVMVKCWDSLKISGIITHNTVEKRQHTKAYIILTES